jgi:hypothetical protein
MGISQHTWSSRLFIEAYKFWGYSLFLNIILAFWELPPLYITPVVEIRPAREGYTGLRKMKIEAKKAKLGHWRLERLKREQVSKRREVWKSLVTDGCDIFIPGFITGWYVCSARTVGVLSVVSSVLAGVDIWERVQAESNN